MPPASVVPFTEVSPQLVRDFLARMGMPAEIVEWRYFDDSFNQGRNRGYAWLRHEKVEGMIGIIPFCVAGGGTSRPAYWSSDWMLADPASNPGMGILLLRRAIEGAGDLFAVGGNENTRKILPRVARGTVSDACQEFVLPLRAGAFLRRIMRMKGLSALPLPRPLYSIPLPWVRKGARLPEVRTEPGVARSIASLMHGNALGWHPSYDWSYLDWQVGRSPLLVSQTSYAPSHGEVRAAALSWSPRASADYWRLAIWHDDEHPEHLASVVQTAISDIYRHKGMIISVLVSHLDDARIAALRAAGFIDTARHRPLYVCSGKQNDATISDLRSLSYLDTDLAYRF